MSTSSVPDPFGTAAIRDRVLAAWAASPARFREDANAEQDLTHGAYRDRLLVELAQNAADAAARSGVDGQLRLSLVDGQLLAANTGAPLDAAGVEALATLRASAKRDGGSVGRFGVGFAAVLTVTDEPSVHSASGGVRFSAADTRAAVAAVPALAAELERRDGQVPVLRLPWAADPVPAGEWDTEVRLPLRADAVEAVRAALAGLDPVLLLALPALRSIDAGGRVLSRVDDAGAVVLRDGAADSRWLVRSASRRPGRRAAGDPAGGGARPSGVDGELGGAGRRHRAAGAAADPTGGARADADRRAAVAAGRAARHVPAGVRPPARHARPGHRRAGDRGRPPVRRPGRRAAARPGPARAGAATRPRRGRAGRRPRRRRPRRPPHDRLAPPGGTPRRRRRPPGGWCPPTPWSWTRRRTGWWRRWRTWCRACCRRPGPGGATPPR